MESQTGDLSSPSSSSSSNAFDTSRISSAPSSPGLVTPTTGSGVDFDGCRAPDIVNLRGSLVSPSREISSPLLPPLLLSPPLAIVAPYDCCPQLSYLSASTTPIPPLRQPALEPIPIPLHRHRHGSTGPASSRRPLQTITSRRSLSSATYRSSTASASSPWTRDLSPAAWIGAYFMFNMGLTLYNKTVLVRFPYPHTLTALHTFCGTVGCIWARRVGYYTPAHLTGRQRVTLALFSVLYALNIALSNLSLQLVTVPFHQVVRASSPVFTILVAWLLRSKRDTGEGLLGIGRKKLLSLIPVIVGVGFATYGDYSFTAWGFILTLFGTFLAALKTVLTSILQTGPASSKPDTPLPTTTAHSEPSFQVQTPASSPRLAAGTSLSFIDAKAKAEKDGGRERRSFEVSGTSIASRFAAVLPSNPFSPIPPSSRSPSPTSSFSFLTKRFDLDFQSGSSRNGEDGVFRSMAVIKLHPLDLLAKMSPLACAQCVVYAILSGEASRLYESRALSGGVGRGWASGGGRNMAMVLGMNGLIAFALNVVSLTANQKNGPLTMTVAANVKQVLTIVLAMSMFQLRISTTNAVGITLTLIGGAWYAVLEYQSKRERLRAETGRR